jgi:hypothetical protein
MEWINPRTRIRALSLMRDKKYDKVQIPAEELMACGLQLA